MRVYVAEKEGELMVLKIFEGVPFWMFINAIALVRVLAKSGYVQESQAKRERLGGSTGGSTSEVMTCRGKITKND